jgi:hypothetical protein
MPRPFHAAFVAVSLLLLGGCCRDTIQTMGSLKDVRERPQHRDAADAPEPSSNSAKIEKDDDDEDDDNKVVETGSVTGAEPCQGAHIAYQATKEYLKNFGPRPPDLPGDKGACKGVQ